MSQNALTLVEASDPLLLVGLIAPENRKLQQRAAATLSQLGDFCPNCGDKALHQALQQRGSPLSSAQALHLLAGLGMASDLVLLGGSLPVTRVHGRQEIARTVQSMAWIQGMLKGDGQEILPAEISFGGGNLEPLKALLSTLEDGAIAYVPPQASGQVGHYIRLESYYPTIQQIVFYDNGAYREMFLADFLRAYFQSQTAPDSAWATLLLTSDQIRYFSKRGGSARVQKGDEKLLLCAACGIVGQGGPDSAAGVQTAGEFLAGRGHDNHGRGLPDDQGVSKLAVEGFPWELLQLAQEQGAAHPEEGMMVYLAAHPNAVIAPELRTALERLSAGKRLNDWQKRLVHEKWLELTPDESNRMEEYQRRAALQLLRDQGYAAPEKWDLGIPLLEIPSRFPPGAPGFQPVFTRHLVASEMYPVTVYSRTDKHVATRKNKRPGHVNMRNSIGVGNQGSLWSGRWINGLDTSSKESFVASDQLKRLVDRIQTQFGYDVTAVKTILQVHLKRTRVDEDLLADFSQLFEKAWTDELAPQETERWNRLWDALASSPIKIAGGLAMPDPVRHVFRLQERLIAAIRQNRRWENSVRDRFRSARDSDGRPLNTQGRDWFKDWIQENATNTPGAAFSALTEFFQTEFMEPEIIERFGIEHNQVDSVTLAYMGPIDRVLGHDRWATVGSREVWNAQPLLDTGLLAGMSDKNLEFVLKQVGVLEQIEVERRRLTNRPVSSADRSDIRRSIFGRFIRDWLREHPDQQGSPQRLVAHNGDLNPLVQQEMVSLLRQMGYRLEQRIVNPATGEERMEPVMTDTERLAVLWEAIFDMYRLDGLMGKLEDGLYTDESEEADAFMPAPYRKLWSDISRNLKQQKGVKYSDDEVARRIAAIEFAEGVWVHRDGRKDNISSEIGLSWYSTLDIGAEGIISHNRPVSIVVVHGKNGELKVQHTSDPETAIGMADPQVVAEALGRSDSLTRQARKQLDDLRARYAAGTLTDEQFSQEIVGLVKNTEDWLQRVSKVLEASNVLIISLSGTQKYAKVERFLDPETQRIQARIIVTDLHGKQVLAEYVSGRKNPVVQKPIDRVAGQITHKFNEIRVDSLTLAGFPSYGLKEIASQLWVWVKTMVAAGVHGRDTDKLHISRPADQKEDPVSFVKPEGRMKREALETFVDNVLEEGHGTLVNSGVGSSDNVAQASTGFVRNLLPLLSYQPVSPVRMVSRPISYNPKTTLVNLITQSGTTALTIMVGTLLRVFGITVVGVTANPKKEDIANVAGDSGGMQEIYAGKERAVYATSTFTASWHALLLQAVELNRIIQARAQKKIDELKADGASDDNARILWLKGVIQDHQERLKKNWEEYLKLEGHLAAILNEAEQGEWSPVNPQSKLRKTAETLKEFNGVRVIGDLYNNPSLPEIGIKVGEVAWINFSAEDVSSDSYKNASLQNTFDILVVTSPARLAEYKEYLDWAERNNRNVVVLTFPWSDMGNLPGDTRQDFNTVRSRIDALADAHPERISVFEVPFLSPGYQPLSDVVFGQNFAVALAVAKGIPFSALDWPRNLSKTITVLGASLFVGAVTTIRKFTSDMQAVAESLRGRWDRFLSGLRQRWGSLSATQQGLQRFPLRMGEFLGSLKVDLNADNLRARFGKKLEDLSRVLIVHDQDDASIAAQMAAVPLGNVETIASNISAEDKLFEPVQKADASYEPVVIRRAANGQRIQFVFERSGIKSEEDRVLVRVEESPGEWVAQVRMTVRLEEDGKKALKDVRVIRVEQKTGKDWKPATAEQTGWRVSVAGKEYRLDHLGKRGVRLQAFSPDLLGVPVDVRSARDAAVDLEARLPGTLVILMSRSNHRGAAEHEVGSIASVDKGRDASEAQSVAQAGKPEDKMAVIASSLSSDRLPYVLVHDTGSQVPAGPMGEAVLPGTDLDANSSVPFYYAALLRLGSELGTLRGVDTDSMYQRALAFLPDVLLQTLEAGYAETVEPGRSFLGDDPDVTGVVVPIQYRPYQFALSLPNGWVSGRGVVTITPEGEVSGEAAQPIQIPVVTDPTTEKVTGLVNRDQRISIEETEYQVLYQEGRGVYLQSVQPDYAGGGSLRQALVALRQNEFGPADNRGRQYTSWFVIGGGQDWSAARAFALALSQRGFFASVGMTDEAVHGPLAMIFDLVAKFFNRSFKKGVSPSFDPDNQENLIGKDAGVLILAVAPETYQAAIVDARRFAARSARVVLVVKESDRNNPEVIGSEAHVILTVPDAPTEISSVSLGMLARLFAEDLVRSMDQQYAYRPGSPYAQAAQLPKIDKESRMGQRRTSLTETARLVGFLSARAQASQPEDPESLVQRNFRRIDVLVRLFGQRGSDASIPQPYAIYQDAGEWHVAAVTAHRKGVELQQVISASDPGVLHPFVANFDSKEGEQDRSWALVHVSFGSQEAAQEWIGRAPAIFGQALPDGANPAFAQVNYEPVAPSSVVSAVSAGEAVSAPAISPVTRIEDLRDRLIRELHQKMKADPHRGIHFKAEYHPAADQTVLAVVGQKGQPNLVAAVTSAIAKAGLSLGDKYGSVSDHNLEDREYFIVPGHVSDEIMGVIRKDLSDTPTLYFKEAISQVLPNLDWSEISAHFSGFNLASERGVALATLSGADGSGQQNRTLLSFAVRGLAETDPRLVQLRASVREIFSLNNLTSDFVDFEHRGVRLFHVSMDGIAADALVRAAVEQINDALSPFAAGPREVPTLSPWTLPAPTAPAAEVPDILQPHRNVVNQLIRGYEANQRVEFRLLKGSTSDQTIVVILGSSKAPGILEILTGTMIDAGISLSDAGIYKTDPVGIAYVVVDVSKRELQRQRAQGEERFAGTSVEKIIAKRIVARFPTPEQIEFKSWLLRKGRNDEEAEWLGTLYRFYHGFPRVAVEEVPGSGGGEMAVVGLAPYAPPLSMSESDFTRAVEARIQSLASEAGILPVQNAAPLAPFVREYDVPHPIVVVQLTFRMSRGWLFDLGIPGAVEDVLTQLSAPSAVSKGGLEEVPAVSPLDLVLPSRWPSFDEVVKRLNEALTSSGFLETVREKLRQVEGVLPGYRPIVKAETDALKKNGVVAENWNNVYVPVDGLTTGDAKRMQDLRLLGTVYLGHLKGDVQLLSGKLVPSEIKNSVLRDVVIGNNVLIRDNILVERYVIGDGAVVTQNRELTAERGTDFGLGKPIPIGPETGGREIKAYPEILLGDVIRLVRSPGDKAGQAKYAEALAKYLEAAKADFGYIGRGAEVSGMADGKNLFVADGGVVFDNTTVHNLILLTGKGERSVVVGTSEIVNLIAQPGVEINGANVVMGVDDGAHGVLMLEHSHAGNGATIKDSVIAPNTGVEKGEVTSSFMGPFIGMHHDSIVIGVDWGEGMGNVGAGTRLGSNHTGRAPDQEMRTGEGVFLGLGSLYSFSGNFVDSPYTIFGKGVSMLPSRIAMPFSLVQKPTVQIPGESPEFMEISPAWIWSDNAYMVMRNEGKYAGRDKSLRSGLKATGKDDPLLRRTPFEILRPDTVNQMIQARDLLAKIDPTTARTANIPNREKPLLYYMGPKSEKNIQPGEIPELGKTIMSEDSRGKAVKTYTAMIQYYGVKGLWAEVQKLATAGRLSEVPALLSTPSTDLRWEHERRVLLTELPGKSVPDILRLLVEAQQKLAGQVRTSKEKDDERGERLLDDYRETHTAAADDKFVKQSAAAAAKLQQDVEALLPQLGGLEEGVREQGLTLEQAIERIPLILAEDLDIREVVFNTFQSGPTELVIQRFPTSDGPRLELNTTGSTRQVLKASPAKLVDLRVSTRTIGDGGKQLDVTPHFPSGLVEGRVLPESNTAMNDEIKKAIAGSFDLHGLALGAALSHVTRNGQMAVQVAFVVENDAEADLIRREASPAATIFSASEYGGSYKTALSMARQFLEGAVELGTDEPVSRTLEDLLRSLFFIKLAPDSIKIWNSFIERVTGALSAQA